MWATSGYIPMVQFQAFRTGQWISQITAVLFKRLSVWFTFPERVGTIGVHCKWSLSSVNIKVNAAFELNTQFRLMQSVSISQQLPRDKTVAENSTKLPESIFQPLNVSSKPRAQRAAIAESTSASSTVRLNLLCVFIRFKHYEVKSKAAIWK